MLFSLLKNKKEGIETEKENESNISGGNLKSKYV